MSGYNHNLAYNGRKFHVQTEDLSSQKLLVTHIFYGGMVVAERTQSYAEEQIEPAELIERMQYQHQQCMRALVFGTFDSVIEGAPERPPPATPTEPNKRADPAIGRVAPRRPTSGAAPTIRDIKVPEEVRKSWEAQRNKPQAVEEVSWAALVPEGEEPEWQKAWTIHELDVSDLAEIRSVRGPHLRRRPRGWDVVRVPAADGPMKWAEFVGVNKNVDEAVTLHVTGSNIPKGIPRGPTSVESRLSQAPTYINPDLPGRWNWPRPKTQPDADAAQLGLRARITRVFTSMWAKIARH